MKSHNTSKAVRRGFSLLETLLVLALLSLLLGGGMVLSLQTYSRANVIQERDILVSLLENVRGESLANIHATAHGLHIDHDAITLFEGVYNVHSVANTIIPRNAHIENDIDATITFAPLSGESVDGAHAIHLRQNDIDLVVTINEHGRIDW